jgi:signal transduction histidine kinase
VWDFGAGWPIVVVAVAGLAAVLLAAGLGRARRATAQALQERGWLLERERESAAAHAVDAERARIARELHDIVSHNVSVMVIQAGAARQVLATQPDEAAAALLAVEAAGRDTMTELRHLLGVLAPSADGADDEPEHAPQPSLSQLSPLIDRIAFAGLPVEVRISGEPRPIPSGVDLTAYRIIQEALTNALKHGDGVKAEVTVRYAEHYLRVEVLNSGPSALAGGEVGGRSRGRSDRAAGRSGAADTAGQPAGQPGDTGAGRGLLGLRERVAVYGGSLDARRRLGGGYRVRARIPLERP